MPVAVSYPGVYVEEIPSGVRTITGVATSITAFIGWAAKGPISYAGLVLSWADFERMYGGFDARSPYLGYAVSQFFINGGTQAYIVRLAYTGTASASLKPAASATLVQGGLTFTAGTVGPDGLLSNAANPGVWAQNYGIAIKNQSGGTNRFRVQVVYAPPSAASEVVVESYENLSIVTPDPQGRYVADVINKQSSFVTVAVAGGTTTPPPDTTSPSPKLAGTANDDGTVLLPSTSTTTGGTFETVVTAATAILDHIDLFNLLCVPGEIVTATVGTFEQYCEGRRAFLIADPDPGITDPTKVTGPPTTGKNSAF
jgi:phage tail sheath protein FI